MGLSQTATVLVAVFAFCLTAVTAQLAYVLWWKRRFRRQSITGGSELDTFSSRGGDPTATPPPSKELLYFFLFCIENKQFRIGSATAPPLPAAAAPPVVDVASKWSTGGENLLCGPSETLFTIAEDSTSETDHRTADLEPRGSVSMDDHVKDDELKEDFVVTVQSDDEEVDSSEYSHDGTTPFSTPCASPPFYTPSPSPVRDDLSRRS